MGPPLNQVKGEVLPQEVPRDEGISLLYTEAVQEEQHTLQADLEDQEDDQH